MKRKQSKRISYKIIGLVFLLILLIICSIGWMFYQQSKPVKDIFIPEWQYPIKQLNFPKSSSKVISHRGYKQGGVENTLEAIEAAAHFEPAYVEIDIQQTKDDEMVVIHDRSLKRLANKKRKIRNSTLKELKKVKLKQNGFVGQIPTLEEAIQLTQQEQQPLLLDIKTNPTDSLDFPQQLVDLLTKYKVQNYYLIQSQDENFLKRVKQINPQIQVGLIITALPSKDFSDFQFLSLKYKLANQNLLDSQVKEKRPIFLWTLDQPAEIELFMHKNIEAVITDDSSTATVLQQTIKPATLSSSYLERIKNAEQKADLKRSLSVP